MNPSSQQPVMIVTGGGQGIGKAVAKIFLEKGYRVVIAEIDEEAGREAETELQGSGKARFIKTDISQETQVRSMIRQAVERFGTINGLVNNAAVSCNKPMTELSLEEWSGVLNVNLTGVFLCSRYAAAHLRQSKGWIINIASTRALMSEADTEAYSASKGGILALTHAMAVSLGPQVRVNCISPGWIDTSRWKKRSLQKDPELRVEDHLQHPAGRVGRPEDVAALAAFLASPEAGFMTGQNLVMDGGMTKKMIYLE